MNITDYDYTKISPSFDSNMQRVEDSGYSTDEDGNPMIGGGLATYSASSYPGHESTEEKNIDGKTLRDVWLDTFIKSKNYKPKVSGFMIDGKTGDAEFSDITLTGGIFNYGKTSFSDSTNAGYIIDSNGIYIGSASDASYLKYDIDLDTFDFSGDITSSTINIPNATTPLFSVDSSGNCSVKSLARDDFHWFTVFESVDGYSKITDGTGSITATADYLEIKTGNVTDNDVEIKKSLGIESFDNDSKFKCNVKFTDNNNQQIYIVVGTAGTNPITTKHYGFFINGQYINATVGDGTSTYETQLQSFSAGTNYVLKASLNVSTGLVSFYINGSLAFTSDGDGTPSGSGNYAFIVRGRTKENDIKGIDVAWLDFWQAND